MLPGLRFDPPPQPHRVLTKKSLLADLRDLLETPSDLIWLVYAY